MKPLDLARLKQKAAGEWVPEWRGVRDDLDRWAVSPWPDDEGGDNAGLGK